jgi:hypothetical protein
MRSEVGAGLAFRCNVLARSGLCVAPLSGFGDLTPNRFFDLLKGFGLALYGFLLLSICRFHEADLMAARETL